MSSNRRNAQNDGADAARHRGASQTQSETPNRHEASLRAATLWNAATNTEDPELRGATYRAFHQAVQDGHNIHD